MMMIFLPRIFTHSERENRRNEKSHKAKNKMIKNCLVNISSSYPARAARSESFFFRM
jgi:hypothetical protein